MQKNEVYHLVTIDNVKVDGTSIVKIFSEMATRHLGCDIRLLNYCHEVPVSYGATICAVDNDSVELLIHEHQAALIKHNNSTLITSKHFPKELGVHCYATYVNVLKRTVILHNFAYAQIRAALRESVRVEVNKPTTVTVSYENVNLVGTMVDISGDGVAIHSTESITFDSNQSVQLSFNLMGNPLSVKGAFVRTVTNLSKGNKYIFQIKPDKMSDTVIGKFIFQRQIEIIQDLKDGFIAE